MRIKDPAGEWKINPESPQLMQRRSPDEKEGTFYRVLPEGRIENYNGFTFKLASRLEGLDFNRNLPYEWRPESEQFGAGPYPVSEPEMKAVVDFIQSHKNINYSLSYHTAIGVFLRPFSNRCDDDMITEDLWLYDKLAKKAEELTEYPTVSVFNEFKFHPKQVVSGCFHDWLYDHHGVISYVVELWDFLKHAGVKCKNLFDSGRA